MSRSRAKGTAFETLIVDYLRKTIYPEAERAPLWGAKDEGDFLNTPGFTLQAKNQAATSLGAWLDQARTQNENYVEAHAPTSWRLPAVVHKRRGRGAPEDQFVTMSLGDWARLVHWINSQ
jgi:hypothetical protein